MKATVLYCDRCAAEGKPSVLATLIVWIRTSLGGRTMRLDVCGDHFALIAGTASPNGAAPPTVPPTGERVWSTRSGRQLEHKTYDALAAFAAKHERFSFEDAQRALDKLGSKARLGKACRLLIDDGKLERYAQGVYQRPGVTMPEPASVELAAAAVVKLAKATPGIKAVAAAALAGIKSDRLWRATRDYLRDRKLARAKGDKSATRYYPV